MAFCFNGPPTPWELPTHAELTAAKRGGGGAATGNLNLALSLGSDSSNESVTHAANGVATVIKISSAAASALPNLSSGQSENSRRRGFLAGPGPSPLTPPSPASTVQIFSEKCLLASNLTLPSSQISTPLAKSLSPPQQQPPQQAPTPPAQAQVLNEVQKQQLLLLLLLQQHHQKLLQVQQQKQQLQKQLAPPVVSNLQDLANLRAQASAAASAGVMGVMASPASAEGAEVMASLHQNRTQSQVVSNPLVSNRPDAASLLARLWGVPTAKPATETDSLLPAGFFSSGSALDPSAPVPAAPIPAAPTLAALVPAAPGCASPSEAVSALVSAIPPDAFLRELSANAATRMVAPFQSERSGSEGGVAGPGTARNMAERSGREKAGSSFADVEREGEGDDEDEGGSAGSSGDGEGDGDGDGDGSGSGGKNSSDSNKGSMKKMRLTQDQSTLLEQVFSKQSRLTHRQKTSLAKSLNVRVRQVEVWFQNRRARTKVKQTEAELEGLRRRCQLLGEENRRLKQQLAEGERREMGERERTESTRGERKREREMGRETGSGPGAEGALKRVKGEDLSVEWELCGSCEEGKGGVSIRTAVKEEHQCGTLGKSEAQTRLFL